MWTYCLKSWLSPQRQNQNQLKVKARKGGIVLWNNYVIFCHSCFPGARTFSAATGLIPLERKKERKKEKKHASTLSAFQISMWLCKCLTQNLRTWPFHVSLILTQNKPLTLLLTLLQCVRSDSNEDACPTIIIWLWCPFCIVRSVLGNAMRLGPMIESPLLVNWKGVFFLSAMLF